MMLLNFRSLIIVFIILFIATLVSIDCISTNEVEGLSTVVRKQHQSSGPTPTKAPTKLTLVAATGNETRNRSDGIHRILYPVVPASSSEVSGKRKARRRRLKKGKQKDKTERHIIDRSDKRPKGLLYMVRSFFLSMFDPTVDGQIDRNLFSRDMRFIPSRPNTYIPGGGRRSFHAISISGNNAGMGGGGGYSAGASGAAAGPVCG